MARAAVLGRLTWRLGSVVESSTRRRGRRASSSTSPTGPGIAPGSTSTSGSPRRTATRRSGATRSRPHPRTGTSCSRSSGSTTARSRPTSSTSCVPATRSSCAARSAATSSGRRRRRAAAPHRRRLRRRPAPLDVRHHGAVGSDVPLRLLYSSRTLEDVHLPRRAGALAAYDEVDIRFTLTRARPEGWRGYRRRIDRDLLARGRLARRGAPARVRLRPDVVRRDCREQLSSSSATTPERIRTERFGPTGGRA